MTREAMSRLVSDLIDNPRDQALQALLNQKLAESSENMRRYLSEVSLHDAISTYVRPEHELTAVRRRADQLEVVRARIARRNVKRSLLAAAACVLFGMVFFGFIHVKPYQGAAITAARYADFTVTRAEKNSENKDSERLAPGDSIQVTQGRVRLDLDHAVYAILEGPSNLQITGRSRVILKEGRVYFAVLKSGVNLKVSTPRAHYRDLGTRFGITILDGTAEELSVFEGMVQIAGGEGQELKVESHEHARVSEVLELIEQPTASYSKSLENQAPRMIHWSFDGEDLTEASGDHPAMSILNPRFSRISPIKMDSLDSGVERITDGRFGSAIRFQGKNTELRTDWQGLTGAAPRTIATWIRTDSPGSSNGVFCIWGDVKDEENLNQKWKLTLNREQNDGPLGALRLTTGTGYQIGVTPLNDGQWHHIAIVLGAYEPKFYIDGIREATVTNLVLPIDTAADTAKSVAVTLGTNHKGSNTETAAFRGDLDEFRIYSGSLSQQQIQNLYEINQTNK